MTHQYGMEKGFDKLFFHFSRKLKYGKYSQDNFIYQNYFKAILIKNVQIIQILSNSQEPFFKNAYRKDSNIVQIILKHSCHFYLYLAEKI